MKKLTFDEAIDRLGDDRPVDASDVLAAALHRTVWVAEWHLPGCLSESRVITANKADAIAACLQFATSDEGPPRGMRSALRKHGRYDSQSPLYGTCVNTVEPTTLRDLCV